MIRVFASIEVIEVGQLQFRPWQQKLVREGRRREGEINKHDTEESLITASHLG
jgi:hypothetical protein